MESVHIRLLFVSFIITTIAYIMAIIKAENEKSEDGKGEENDKK